MPNDSVSALPAASPPEALPPAPEARRDWGQWVSRTFNFVYVALSIIILWFWPATLEPERGFWLRGAWVLLAFALDLGVVQGCKHIFYAPRPNAQSGWKWGRHQGSGFPSGHTVPAWMLATMMFQAHGAWGAAWFLGAALIAWARWRVQAHSAPQVLGSIPLGIGMAVAVGRVF